MADKIDFDKFPSKSGDPNLPRVASQNKSQFVDYDLIFIDAKTGYVYGNWRDTADDACKYKKVDRYIDRKDLRNYVFAQACPPSRDGIYEFTVATSP
jgi:hypothetical protein